MTWHNFFKSFTSFAVPDLTDGEGLFLIFPLVALNGDDVVLSLISSPLPFLSVLLEPLTVA